MTEQHYHDEAVILAKLAHMISAQRVRIIGEIKVHSNIIPAPEPWATDEIMYNFQLLEHVRKVQP